MNLVLAEQRITETGHKCFDQIDPSNQYIRSYPFLLRATELLYEKMEEDATVVISHIAYGWMPTILKNFDFSTHKSGNFKNARNISSFDDAEKMISEFKYSPINKSWVGLSKVLHFINPQFFPIWDSKVAKHFEVSGAFQMKNRQNYIDYIGFIQSQLERETVTQVQKEFTKRVNYQISRVRACEFILFSI